MHNQVAGQSPSVVQSMVSATQLDVPVGADVHVRLGGAPSPETVPSQTPLTSGVHLK